MQTITSTIKSPTGIEIPVSETVQFNRWDSRTTVEMKVVQELWDCCLSRTEPLHSVSTIGNAVSIVSGLIDPLRFGKPDATWCEHGYVVAGGSLKHGEYIGLIWMEEHGDDKYIVIQTFANNDWITDNEGEPTVQRVYIVDTIGDKLVLTDEELLDVLGTVAYKVNETEGESHANIRK